MFKILANVGDDLVVGTHKGNVGIISRCIMEDEGLAESDELQVQEAVPGRNKWVIPHFPPQSLYPVDYFTKAEMAQIDIEHEIVDLRLWRYGDFYIRVGYSEATRTWIKSKVVR